MSHLACDHTIWGKHSSHNLEPALGFLHVSSLVPITTKSTMPRRKRQRKIIMPSSDAVVSPQDSLTGEMDASSAPEKEPKLATNPIVSDAPSMNDLESSPTLSGLIEDMFIEVGLSTAITVYQKLQIVHRTHRFCSILRPLTYFIYPGQTQACIT